MSPPSDPLELHAAAGSMAEFLAPQNSFLRETKKMRLTPPKRKTDKSGFLRSSGSGQAPSRLRVPGWWSWEAVQTIMAGDIRL